jgi:hypothetical protein
MFSGISRRVSGSWPADHETGAGDNALVICRDDAAIDSMALPKIIRVDNQVFGGNR